jgi:hypothetical protein
MSVQETDILSIMTNKIIISIKQEQRKTKFERGKVMLNF